MLLFTIQFIVEVFVRVILLFLVTEQFVEEVQLLVYLDVVFELEHVVDHALEQVLPVDFGEVFHLRDVFDGVRHEVAVQDGFEVDERRQVVLLDGFRGVRVEEHCALLFELLQVALERVVFVHETLEVAFLHVVFDKPLVVAADGFLGVYLACVDHYPFESHCFGSESLLFHELFQDFSSLLDFVPLFS